MSNLINVISSRKAITHASVRKGFRVRLCNRNVNTLTDHQVSDRSVTCGNCSRMIARVHADALDLHKAFLSGVAQAEVPAELLGRPEGLDKMSDTMLSDEILWARSELALFTDPGHLIAYARRLTSLKLERRWRQAVTS